MSPGVRQKAIIVAVAAVVLAGHPLSACAEGEKRAQALIPPPLQEEQAFLLRRLDKTKADLEVFRLFSENFRKNGDTMALAQLQRPVDDFLKKHADDLLEVSSRRLTLDTARVTAEALIIKGRLFINLGRVDAARSTLVELRKLFGAYQQMSAELPGKTTTLDEGIRALDEELAQLAAPAAAPP